jgi:hypothetical protein
VSLDPAGPRCSQLAAAAGEPLAGTAPRADTWLVVEHPEGWGDAALARTGSGVRVVLARGPRGPRGPGFRVWVAHGTGQPSLRLGHVDDPGEVAAWDLAAVARGDRRDWGRPVDGPLLAVCANGRRDRCCGHAGGRLAEELWAGPHRDQVLTCTHLGGHRFAPTALLLPWGVLHGRLDLRGAQGVLADAAAGRTPPGTLRGHSSLAEAGQVAELHAREQTGYDGLAPLGVDVEHGHGGEGAEQGAPRRASARVALPDGRELAVALVQRVHRQVASCGRAAEPTLRWSVAR